MEEAKYRNYDILSDNDENVPEPIVTGIVTKEYREVLKYAPKWTTWPDYEQVRWLNSTIEWLWPGLNKAICKMVCFHATRSIAVEELQSLSTFSSRTHCHASRGSSDSKGGLAAVSRFASCNIASWVSGPMQS